LIFQSKVEVSVTSWGGLESLKTIAAINQQTNSDGRRSERPTCRKKQQEERPPSGQVCGRGAKGKMGEKKVVAELQ